MGRASCSCEWRPVATHNELTPSNAINSEGHMGIGTSEGIVCDFQGPYYVSDRGRSMAFGNPTRALKVDISSLDGGSERWDECIQQANAEYNTRSKPN